MSLSPISPKNLDFVLVTFVLFSVFIVMWLENVVYTILPWGLNEALLVAKGLFLNSPSI